MIQAYTFDNSIPHNADVDSRIIRDQFIGSGSFISTGDKNGSINDDAHAVEIVNDTITFRPKSTVTFVAGGRLFTTDDVVTANLIKTSPDGKKTLSRFYVNVSKSEPFVELVASPSYPLDDYNGDSFSVKYQVIAVKNGTTIDVYPALGYSGYFNAGGCVALHEALKNKKNKSIDYSVVSDGASNLRLIGNDLFSVSGFSRGALEKGADIHTIKHRLQRLVIDTDSEYYLQVFSNDFVGLLIVETSDNSLFRIKDIIKCIGNIPKNSTGWSYSGIIKGSIETY